MLTGATTTNSGRRLRFTTTLTEPQTPAHAGLIQSLGDHVVLLVRAG